MSWPSPAKLNLYLTIIGRREDGYHELQTVFQLIDYADAIDIAVLDSGRIVLGSAIGGVSDESNLCLRAAKKLKEKTGVSGGARIAVCKRLPIGAGLGGGSSNAATTLHALNRLWNIGLSTTELMQIGLELGADVPVFVLGRSAWATGIGEKLTPIQLPQYWYLVLNPGVHVSTKEIFSAPRLERARPPIEVDDFMQNPLAPETVNVCQAVVFEKYPAIKRAYDWLRACQQVSVVGMSGTGSSLFAAFTTQALARQTLTQLPGHWRGFVAKGLDQSPLLYA